MQQRIIGFDIARAYAIFGMFIVNFNFSFGSFQSKSFLGQFLNLFVGNSTAIFIVCAGMGVSLMTNRFPEYTSQERERFKSTIIKRSWFLFALGLLLYSWWPGDILHFYGGYMHIAAFILFIPKKYYLWIAFFALTIFHLMLLVIHIDTSWDFKTFKYTDFWTPLGFLRNTIYNGWNSIFPWLSYFVIGMFLGRLNWQDKSTKKNIFILSLLFFILFEGLRYLAKQNIFTEYWTYYIMSEYFPAYLPFIFITTSFALMVITVCIWLGNKYAKSSLVKWLSDTGKMTLTNYVQHLTIGMLIIQNVTGIKYTGFLQTEKSVSPLYILIYSIIYFIGSVIFSSLWTKRFKRGPLEMLMRKISY